MFVSMQFIYLNFLQFGHLDFFGLNSINLLELIEASHSCLFHKPAIPYPNQMNQELYNAHLLLLILI